ncbi:MAG: BrnT family toxin [bacterium]
MKISCDAAKRARTLQERGVDFQDANEVFAGRVYEIEDVRRDYGERRIMCFGMLHERMVVVGYVQRGDTRHVFSMRKANVKEQQRYTNLLR